MAPVRAVKLVALTIAFLAALGTPPAHAENNLWTYITIGDAYDVCASAYHDDGHSLSMKLVVLGAQQDGISTATLQGEQSAQGSHVSRCTSGVFKPTTGAVYVLMEINYAGVTVNRYAYCTTQGGAKSCTGTGEVSQ